MKTNVVYLICFGDSEKNLNIAVKNQVIGIKRHMQFDEDGELYLIIKRSNEWTVVGKARVIGETDKNPFDKPNNYVTFGIDNIEMCKPYAINTILREELGNSFGLMLRAPGAISSQKFIERIHSLFCAI